MTFVETVVKLSQRYADRKIRVEIDVDKLEPTGAEMAGRATYSRIQEYVREKHGLKVSNLYISQIKRECGLEVEDSYNKPKSENARVPKCPEKKREAIMDALRHFKLI